MRNRRCRTHRSRSGIHAGWYGGMRRGVPGWAYRFSVVLDGQASGVREARKTTRPAASPTRSTLDPGGLWIIAGSVPRHSLRRLISSASDGPPAESPTHGPARPGAARQRATARESRGEQDIDPQNQKRYSNRVRCLRNHCSRPGIPQQPVRPADGPRAGDRWPAMVGRTVASLQTESSHALADQAEAHRSASSSTDRTARRTARRLIPGRPGGRRGRSPGGRRPPGGGRHSPPRGSHRNTRRRAAADRGAGETVGLSRSVGPDQPRRGPRRGSVPAQVSRCRRPVRLEQLRIGVQEDQDVAAGLDAAEVVGRGEPPVLESSTSRTSGKSRRVASQESSSLALSITRTSASGSSRRTDAKTRPRGAGRRCGSL